LLPVPDRREIAKLSRDTRLETSMNGQRGVRR
jgi:hypothetical protein